IGVLNGQKRGAVAVEIFEASDDGEAFGNQRFNRDDVATLIDGVHEIVFVEIPVKVAVLVATIGAVENFGVQDLVLQASRKNGGVTELDIGLIDRDGIAPSVVIDQGDVGNGSTGIGLGGGFESQFPIDVRGERPARTEVFVRVFVRHFARNA